jgi:hypothetical protein
MRLFLAISAACTALATAIVFLPSPAALAYRGSDFLAARRRQPVVFVVRHYVARAPVYNLYELPVISQRNRKSSIAGPMRPLPRWNAVNVQDPADSESYWVRQRSDALWSVCKDEFSGGDEYECFQRNSRLLRHHIVSINRENVY